MDSLYLYKLGFLTKLIIKIKSKNRYFFTKRFNKVYVQKKVFEDKFNFLISTITEKTSCRKIIILNIADTNPANKQRSFNYEKNIIEYNQILTKIADKFKHKCELIDMFKLSQNSNFLLDDGIHIQSPSHILLADEIHKIIKKEEKVFN